jgi:polar amino acid transport system substrate-binding protein
MAQKQHLLPRAKRSRYIALGVVLGLCFFYVIRSCSIHTLSESYYTIGQNTRWPELYLMGKEQHLSAFNHELLATIAKQQHIRLRLIVTSHLMKELEQGKLQGMLTTLQPNYSNANHLLFSDPYFLTGPVLIISAYVSPPELNEKGKKIVGVPSQSPLLSSLEQDPSIQVKIYEDILPALADLSERRIDGAIFPAIPAYTYTQTFYKHELKIATAPLTDEGIRLATLKNEGGESLIKKFNQGLNQLKQNGGYNKMLEHWGLSNVEKIVPEREGNSFL